MNINLHTPLVDAIVETSCSFSEAPTVGVLVLIVDWDVEEGIDSFGSVCLFEHLGISLSCQDLLRLLEVDDCSSTMG